METKAIGKRATTDSHKRTTTAGAFYLNFTRLYLFALIFALLLHLIWEWFSAEPIMPPHGPSMLNDIKMAHGTLRCGVKVEPDIGFVVSMFLRLGILFPGAFKTRPDPTVSYNRRLGILERNEPPEPAPPDDFSHGAVYNQSIPTLADWFKSVAGLMEFYEQNFASQLFYYSLISLLGLLSILFPLKRFKKNESPIYSTTIALVVVASACDLIAYYQHLNPFNTSPWQV